MLTSIKRFLAQQARKPSGWFGYVVAPKVFNKENADMEQFALELLDPQENDHILEIGFGNGRLLAQIMPRIGNGKVCGIDISEQMIARATKLNKQWLEQGNLEISQASIENIPYPDEAFNKVLTVNTIYFWPDPTQNLPEVQRVLKPGGRFLCALRLKQQMASSESAFKNAVVGENRQVFENLYQADEVKQLFTSAGFNNVTLHEKAGAKETVYVVSGEKG